MIFVLSGTVSLMNLASSQPTGKLTAPPTEVVGRAVRPGARVLSGVSPGKANVGKGEGLDSGVGLACGVGEAACAVWVCCSLNCAINVSAAAVYSALTSGVGSGDLPMLQAVRASIVESAPMIAQIFLCKHD